MLFHRSMLPVSSFVENHDTLTIEQFTPKTMDLIDELDFASALNYCYFKIGRLLSVVTHVTPIVTHVTQ